MFRFAQIYPWTVCGSGLLEALVAGNINCFSPPSFFPASVLYLGKFWFHKFWARRAYLCHTTDKYLVTNATLFIFYFTDCYWDEYILHTVILLGGCMVVWVWSRLEACLFWSWIHVIVVRVKVSRGFEPLPPMVIDSADTNQPSNGQICMDKSHLLPNNPDRL